MNKKVLLSLLIYFGTYLLFDLIKWVVDFSSFTSAMINLMVPPIVLIIVLYLLKDECKVKLFEKDRASVVKSLLVILGGFIIIVLGQKMISSIPLKALNPGGSNSESLLVTLPMVIIVQALIAPVLEELIFRRGIQGILHRKFNPFLSILITSILFAVWHMSLAGLLQRFWMSLILSTSYYYTNRLAVPMVTHILLNSFVGIAILLLS
ncbi:CPBP family intramembrane glutamic endopeptidase [Neobacillus sp. D3-1R]|uniref:CPBP family intramembrane glutamic endopeptidase n=1 Tax=Neobacillus sp. D3-1R TaxID=3445778 RepID=UPI003FA16E37